MAVKKTEASPPLKPHIQFDEFETVDLRIGKVVAAERVAKSERLIRLDVDFGKAIEVRSIFTGIAAWYTAEELLGKKFIFVANLEPKPMIGSESQGMMLAADDGEKAIVLPVDDLVPTGLVVR